MVVLKMRNESAACRPDYEHDFKVQCAKNEELKKCIDFLQEENNKLRCENADLHQDYDSMETEFIRMRAQLDIVYLIFGKR